MQVTELVNRYLSRYRLAQVFEADELAHMLLPQTDVVNSWVVQSPGAPPPASTQTPGSVTSGTVCRVLPSPLHSIGKLPAASWCPDEQPVAEV